MRKNWVWKTTPYGITLWFSCFFLLSALISCGTVWFCQNFHGKRLLVRWKCPNGAKFRIVCSVIFHCEIFLYFENAHELAGCGRYALSWVDVFSAGFSLIATTPRVKKVWKQLETIGLTSENWSHNKNWYKNRPKEVTPVL